MNLFGTLLAAALTFGVCFLIDRGFTNTFRGRSQHKTGLSVRLNKRYALFGLVLAVIGILGICLGITQSLGLLIGSIVVLLMGIGLIVYYLSFGVYYDADTFLLTTFGKKTRHYRFGDVKSQRLYTLQGGGILVELHLLDGQTVSLQSAMEGTYAFLDHAFAAWCRQTGRAPDSCTFHDPAQSLWFPTEEET